MSMPICEMHRALYQRVRASFSASSEASQSLRYTSKRSRPLRWHRQHSQVHVGLNWLREVAGDRACLRLAMVQSPAWRARATENSAQD